jgi:hypothetical protein
MSLWPYKSEMCSPVKLILKLVLCSENLILQLWKYSFSFAHNCFTSGPWRESGWEQIRHTAAAGALKLLSVDCPPGMHHDLRVDWKEEELWTVSLKTSAVQVFPRQCQNWMRSVVDLFTFNRLFHISLQVIILII